MSEFKDIFNHQFAFLFLILCSYFLALQLRSKFKNINPLVISCLAVFLYLSAFGINYDDFAPSGELISFWLQPAVVCLAIPLHKQFAKIKSQFLPIFLSQIAGSLAGIISGVYLALLFGAEKQVALSIAAKSTTMPIALEISKILDGIPAITATTVFLAGLSGQLLGFYILRRFHIFNPVSQSLALGSASHAMGVAVSLQYGQKFAAYASLGLIMNGLISAFLAPLLF